MNNEGKQAWELTPEKFLNEVEVGRLLRRAEELWTVGEVKKRKGLVRDAFLIYTAIFTGLRNSEICDLKVEDLRIGNGESHLIVRNGKGGKRRIVHIGREYKAILKRYLTWKLDRGELKQDAYLLRTNRAAHYRPPSLWLRWHRYSPEKTLHSARHTAATLLYRASGNNLRAVQKHLGHSRITTTQIYADVAPDVMRESMSAMERLANSCRKGVGRYVSGDTDTQDSVQVPA